MRIFNVFLAILMSMAIAACGGKSDPAPAAATYSISGTITGAAAVSVALSGAATATTTTDASGNYSFGGLSNGSYTVTPSKAGFAFTPTNLAVTVSGANVSAQNFAAVAAANTYSISGTTNIAGATVSLAGANTGSVVAGTGGSYSFSGLVPGAYTVTPNLAGYTFSPSNAPVTIAAANVPGINFTPTVIPVPHSISGNVSGTGNSGVTINVTGAANASATTDGSGNYTVSNVLDGTYTVTPIKTGYTFTPNSASVTVAGANVTAPNFAAVANSSVQAVVSGSITGAWIEGVTITMSGGASGTTTTNASGNYSFTVASGASYTFTPTLAGYGFTAASQTVAIPGGSSTAVTLPAMASSSSATTLTSVSGTLVYNGVKTGRTMIRLVDSTCTASCQTRGFTSLPSAPSSSAAGGTNFTIRGVQPGTYLVRSYIDTLGNGAGNASNPGVTSTAFTVAVGANNIGSFTINDNVAPAPVTPTIQIVAPSDRAALVFHSIPVTANGREVATSYKVYTGANDPTASNGPVFTFGANGTNGNARFISGLSNGLTYFKVSAVVGSGASAVESAPSAVSAVTIGATTGANTLTGTVTFPGAATGPLMVGAYSDTGGGVYFTTIANPTSPQNFSVSGIPNGTFYHFAIIDKNGNGQIDLGDLHNTGGDGGFVTFAGGTTTNNVDLTPNAVNARAVSQTNHWTDGTNHGYGLQVGTYNGVKRVVSSVLYSGPNIAVPMDLSVDSGYTTWLSLNTTVPAVGDSYKYKLTYSDGTSELVSASVSGVVSTANMPTVLTVNTTAPYSRTAPQFTWAAPATPLASYTYNVGLNGNGISWWYPQGNSLPSSTLNAVYNGTALTTGSTYFWQVMVRDAATGNTGTFQAPPYTP